MRALPFLAAATGVLGCLQPVSEDDAGVVVMDAGTCGDGGYLAFPASVPACEHFAGNIRIGCPTNLSDLSGLAGLRSVSGVVSIEFCQLTTLHGLERLESAGTLILSDMWNLEHLRDLQSLRSLNSLGIINAPALTSLEGLDRITRAELVLDKLPRIDSLHGLEGLERTRTLSITDTAVPSLAELSRLQAVDGDLLIYSNPQLPQSEIDALLARVSVQGQVVTYDNGP